MDFLHDDGPVISALTDTPLATNERKKKNGEFCQRYVAQTSARTHWLRLGIKLLPTFVQLAVTLTVHLATSSAPSRSSFSHSSSSFMWAAHCQKPDLVAIVSRFDVLSFHFFLLSLVDSLSTLSLPLSACAHTQGWGSHVHVCPRPCLRNFVDGPRLATH